MLQERWRYLVGPVVHEKTHASDGDSKRKHGVEEDGGHHKIHDVSELISHVQT
jgi:hypothetical protein